MGDLKRKVRQDLLDRVVGLPPSAIARCWMSRGRWIALLDCGLRPQPTDPKVAFVSSTAGGAMARLKDWLILDLQGGTSADASAPHWADDDLRQRLLPLWEEKAARVGYSLTAEGAARRHEQERGARAELKRGPQALAGVRPTPPGRQDGRLGQLDTQEGDAQAREARRKQFLIDKTRRGEWRARRSAWQRA